MTIATQVLILFFVVLIGAYCRKLGYFTDETIRGVTKLVVNVALPCLTIANLQRPFDMNVLIGFVLTFFLTLIFILAALFGSMWLFRNRPHDRRVVLANLEAFSNCGFMGYPIILAFKPDLMIYAVSYNIAYIIISWTVGVSMFGGKETVDLRRVVLNPNLIASVIGIALFCLGITLPSVPAQVLSTVGGLTTPLSMLIIGTRIYGIRLSDLADKDYHISSLIRLVVLPLIIFLVMKPLGLPDDVAKTIFLLTAMPFGTIPVMQAELYGGDSIFAARASVYSTLLSMVTIPILSLLL